MITDFKALTIPEGEVVKIEDSLGRILWQKASPLPYDAEIEYLKGDGSAYLDMGFPTSLLNSINTNFELGFTLTALRTYVFGGANKYGRQFVILPSGQFRPDWATGTNILPDNPPVLSIGTQYTLAQVNGVFSVSTMSLEMAGSSWADNNFFLFTKNPREASTQFDGKIHYMTITDRATGNLIHNYVPVRIGQVGYFYDRVDGTLIGNAGTGDFVLGPDK